MILKIIIVMDPNNLVVNVSDNHLDFCRPKQFFNKPFEGTNHINHATDRLCLIPYKQIAVGFYKYENEPYEHYIDRFMNNASQYYFVTIDPEYNTYLDLFALFILQSKKVKKGLDYKCSRSRSLFDYYFDESTLSFNGRMIKRHNCWFLDFNSLRNFSVSNIFCDIPNFFLENP
jgi:hypothetical protein